MVKARSTCRRRTARARSLPLVGAALAALTAGEVRASGLGVARFGGEHGHPTTDNPTAIYYNPAGIALKPGTRIFFDATLALRWASYQRPEGAISSMDGTPEGARDANIGTARLFNTIAGPFAGVSSDFGTKFFSAGLSLSFPFGGQSRWKLNEKYAGDQTYPGAVDGVQRWYTIDGKLRSMYLTAAFAFNIPRIGLSIGVSGSAIRSEIDTIRARNPDSTDDLVSTLDGSLKEGRSWVRASGWQGAFGIGVIWNWRSKLWIGASYSSQPNVVGGMTLRGTLNNAFNNNAPEAPLAIEVTQTLPDTVRLGFRFRPIPRLELRIFGDYSRWSVFDKQCILDASKAGRRCDFPGADRAFDDPESFGGPAGEATEGVVQHLPRMWKDAGGVRLGASYWVIEPLELYAGVGFDSNAVPLQTLDAALMDAHKISASIGARWQIVKNFALALTFTDIAFLKADSRGKSLLHKFQSPTRQPSAEGVYKQNLFVTNLYFDVSF